MTRRRVLERIGRLSVKTRSLQPLSRVSPARRGKVSRPCRATVRHRLVTSFSQGAQAVLGAISAIRARFNMTGASSDRRSLSKGAVEVLAAWRPRVVTCKNEAVAARQPTRIVNGAVGVGPRRICELAKVFLLLQWPRRQGSVCVQKILLALPAPQECPELIGAKASCVSFLVTSRGSRKMSSR